MTIPAIAAAVSILAGAIAAVTGFGIGSLLTPVLSRRFDMPLAVAMVSIPHFLATALRLWILRHDVDRRVLKSFGLMSAAGGLVGALLQPAASARSLTIVFAILLTFAGIAGLTGLSERMRLGKTAGWIAGVVSGALGGPVGNQGGIRSAALLGYDLPPKAFVATATAAAVMVDLARLPVYVVTERDRLLEQLPSVAVLSVAAIVGTVLGERLLTQLPASAFLKVVSLVVMMLGIYIFTRT
jgi:uncharacterized membrane protein YfcA